MRVYESCQGRQAGRQALTAARHINPPRHTKRTAPPAALNPRLSLIIMRTRRRQLSGPWRPAIRVLGSARLRGMCACVVWN